MALGDFVAYSPSTQQIGSDVYAVKANSFAPSINAGEPVMIAALGSAFVVQYTNDALNVGSNFMVGIATGGSNAVLSSTSTETTTTNGFVSAQTAFNDGASWLGVPTTPSLWNTQAKYNALLNARVNIDAGTAAGVVGTVFTVGATDSVNNGCVVKHISIIATPNKVRIAFRSGLDYMN